MSDPVLFRALIFMAVLAPLSGIIGSLAVVRNNMFEADVLSHVGFTGAFVGLVMGLSFFTSVHLSLLLVAAFFAAGAVAKKSSDATTGIISTLILGVGALFTHIYATGHSGKTSTSLTSVAFGSLFSLTSTRVYYAVGELLIVALALTLITRPLLFVSFDKSGAEVALLPIRRITAVYFFALGLIVAIGTQAIGAFVVLALLAAPAMSIQQFSLPPWKTTLYSGALCLLIAWVGVFLAWFVPTIPPSVAVVAVATTVYVLISTITNKRRTTKR